jgi:hypothetical protein
MAVYIPIGHGLESLHIPRKKVPDGCTVTVIETCGGAHMWTKNSEIFEHTQIKTFLEKHPDKLKIFSNPKENSHILNDIFGSVAIYGPGEKYPNISYSLLLADNPVESSPGIRHSGLVPLEVFISPDFTTTNIATKLKTANDNQADPINGLYPLLTLDNATMNLETFTIWLKNMLEIYKYSIHPSKDDFIKYFNNEMRGIYDLYKDSDYHFDADKAPGDTIRFATQIFMTHIFDKSSDRKRYQWNGYVSTSLESLMNRFPGNYIHMVCRGTRETSLPFGIGYNPSPHLEHTFEEWGLRANGMSSEQKKAAIKEILESFKTNEAKSKLNEFSSKNTRKIALAVLRKSLEKRPGVFYYTGNNEGRKVYENNNTNFLLTADNKQLIQKLTKPRNIKPSNVYLKSQSAGKLTRKKKKTRA